MEQVRIMVIYMKFKRCRYIMLLIFIIGITFYNILLQKNIIDFNKTIYNVVYIYIGIFVLWIFIELSIFSKKDLKNVKTQYNKKSNAQKRMFTLIIV